MTCATVQLRLKSGLLMTNQIRKFWYSYDYVIYRAEYQELIFLLDFCTLLNIYSSLVEPYISYDLFAWGQALNIHLDKIVILRKRALRSMYFADYKSHSVPLFVNSVILPPCHMIFTISVLHPIYQIYLLAPNKFIPLPRGLQ